MCPLSYAFIIRVKKSLQRDFSSVVNNDALKPNLHASLPKLQVNAVLFDCTWVFFFSFCSFIIWTISSHAVTLLPRLLPFLSSTLGHVLNCVCVCLCMHVWALFFFHIECGCVCVCVRLIVSPSAWKWSEMTDLAWETNTSAAGTAGSLWAAAEVLILLFGLVGNWPTSVSFFFFSFFHPLPSLSHFLYPLQGFTLLLFFFSLFASYHFFWLKSLTLKFARKKKRRQETCTARCSCPDWSGGTLSTLRSMFGLW